MRFAPKSSDGRTLALEMAGPPPRIPKPSNTRMPASAPDCQGLSLDRPLHLVTYRIDPESMGTLYGLPQRAFCINEVPRLDDLFQRLQSSRPCDLILVGCGAARQHSPDFLDALHQLRPGLPVGTLCVSGDCAGESAVELLRAGLAGVLPRTLGPGALAGAIRLVANGGRYAPPEMLVSIDKTETGSNGCTHCFSRLPKDDRLAALSRRERDVAQLLAQGLANKEIAWQLALQEVTIKVHTTSIYRKLGVRNRAQAVAKLVAAE